MDNLVLRKVFGVVTVLLRIGCGYKSKNNFFQFITYGRFFSNNVQQAITAPAVAPNIQLRFLTALSFFCQ